MAKPNERQLARSLKLEPTFLERTLSHIAPKTAQRLHRSRMQFEMQASIGRSMGGYIGARRDRAATADWSPGGGSPATDIGPDLPMLRERSRDQMRNAPVAVGGLNSDVLHVVGSGLSYTPAIDAKQLGISEERAVAWTMDTKARFKAWAESTDCHLQRQLDFYSLTELAYRSWLESGDVFALTPMIERDGETMLALQLIEADRVSNPSGSRDSETLQDGIGLDAATGEAVAVHVAKFHPGDFRGGANSWQPVRIRGEKTGRRNVIHLFDCLRPGQVRGVPWIAPILEPLKQLNKWSDAELNAAVVSSVWAVFLEMDAEGFQELFDDESATRVINDAQRWSGKIESGQAINLLPGEKAEMKTPGRPNPAFDPFWTAMVRQMGMTLGMPYEVLVMHFQSSYTAARGAFMMAWRRWYQRRDKMAKGFCQPVLELWLANEVSAGRIAAPGFFASKVMRAAWCAAMWTGDGPGSVDPVKEATAAKMRVDMETSTLQAESILHDGQDWEAKHRQRAKEVKMQRDDGTLPADSASVPASEPLMPLDNGSDDDTEAPPRAPVPPPQPPMPQPTRAPTPQRRLK
jgi:lambda family phage portal protein